ncbi:hypothetical protein L1049_000268 [Liquidambar formosana]|uniref:Uncharacterized protein n=1 Tax=Liquidambar formosana TaxID=63359 RepID=A0AAP0R4P8_LIQFO
MLHSLYLPRVYSISPTKNPNSYSLSSSPYPPHLLRFRTSQHENLRYLKTLGIIADPPAKTRKTLSLETLDQILSTVNFLKSKGFSDADFPRIANLAPNSSPPTSTPPTLNLSSTSSPFFHIDRFSLVWLAEMAMIVRCEKLEGGTAVDDGSGTAGLPYRNVVVARGDGDEVGSSEVTKVIGHHHCDSPWKCRDKPTMVRGWGRVRLVGDLKDGGFIVKFVMGGWKRE